MNTVEIYLKKESVIPFLTEYLVGEPTKDKYGDVSVYHLMQDEIFLKKIFRF